jgi:DNA-binding NarL/FixJ family response regulator
MIRPTTVMLAEDHHLVREALRALLEERTEVDVIGQAEDGAEAIELAQELKPEIVVMDISMPNLNGLEATRRLMELGDPPQVIILSQHKRQEYVVQALQAGASGYLLKDSITDELIEAIQTVKEGLTYLSEQLPREEILGLIRRGETLPNPVERLTPREREVIQLVAEGYTNRQIAVKLSISVKTVEKHRYNLMDKLNMSDVTALVRFAVANGIVSAQRE